MAFRPKVLGVAGVAGLLAFATLDNVAWFARCYGRTLTQTERNAILLGDDSAAVLDRLTAPDTRGRLVLSEYPMIGYLVTVYVPLRSWVSHYYNTPDVADRQEELQSFFATGRLIDAWTSHRLVAVVDSLADPDAVHRLQTTGFSIAGEYSHAIVLVYDPR